MPSTDLDQQVRLQLSQLMTGLLPLRDFQIWFAPVAWRLGRPENRGSHPLARRVELRLAEYTNGDWSEAELMRLLGVLLRNDRQPVTLAVGRGDRTYEGGVADQWYSPVRTTAGVEHPPPSPREKVYATYTSAPTWQYFAQ